MRNRKITGKKEMVLVLESKSESFFFSFSSENIKITENVAANANYDYSDNLAVSMRSFLRPCSSFLIKYITIFSDNFDAHSQWHYEIVLSA
jgi:hypothetical protein